MGNRELKLADKRCQIYRKNVYLDGFKCAFFLNSEIDYQLKLFLVALHLPGLFPFPDSRFIYRCFWFKGDVYKCCPVEFINFKEQRLVWFKFQ